MLFDRLLGYCERYENWLWPLVSSARLFEFEKVPHELFKDPKDNNSVFHFLRDEGHEFHLPFPCVAVEDPASCVVLADVDWESVVKKDGKKDGSFRPLLMREPQAGINPKRFWVEIVSIDASMDRFDPADNLAGLWKSDDWGWMSNQYAGCHVLMAGIVENLKVRAHNSDGTGEWEMDGNVGFCGLMDPRLGNRLDMQEMKDASDLFSRGVTFAGHAAKKTPLGNVVVGVKEMVYAQLGSNFIVERSPVKVRKSHAKGVKALRSHERPIFTVIRSNEVRQRLRLPEPTGISRSPHERRGHFRTFHSERFVSARGKKKWINPMWVGPSESTIGNHRYKVRLDL